MLKMDCIYWSFLAPTNEFNADANHGMLKDFQDKTLLFPLFDTIELAQAIEVEGNIEEEDIYDTYEDLLHEIEELKVELTSIVVTPSSSLGKEVFDTPAVKGITDRKGRLRKDRYSALLYANYYARNRNKEDAFKVNYQAVGGTRESIKKTKTIESLPQQMYYGPGVLKHGSKNPWLKAGYVQHRLR
jgi:hypothetical protein